MTLQELANSVPRWPHGHVNNAAASRFIFLLVELGISGNVSLESLAELNGLAARLNALSRQSPPPTTGGDAPTGGTPAAMALAA